MNFTTAGRARHSLLEYLSIGFVFLVGGSTASMFGLFMDAALLAHGLSQIEVLLLSNFLTGIVACGLYWGIRVRKSDHQLIFEDRVNKVALMNHYIKPALTTIAIHGKNMNNLESGMAILQAIKRIDWALTILPRGWDIERYIAKPPKATVIEMPLQPPPSSAMASPRRSA